MRHTCEHCHTRYEIPDDKVRGRRVKVRCRHCDGIMFVVGPDAPPLVPLGGAGAAYFVAVDRQPRGPLGAKELLLLAREGVVDARSLVWRLGWKGWQRVIEASELRWLYEAVMRAELEGASATLDAFDRAALLSDGSGYFPDPTLKSGIILLDQTTQHHLETLARKQHLSMPTPRRRPRIPVSALAASLLLGMMTGGAAYLLGLGQGVPALSTMLHLATRALAQL